MAKEAELASKEAALASALNGSCTSMAYGGLTLGVEGRQPRGMP
jgi:hypothetical protein